MNEKPGQPSNYGPAIAASFTSLFLYLVLFFARALDDNRSISWADVFTVADPVRVFLFLALCILAAWALSRLSLLERYPSLFLFFSSFMLTAPFWSGPEIIVDASRYFAQAKHLELYGVGFFLREWGRDIAIWTDMPVVPFFYGLIFKFFGENRLYIQIFTTLLFSLSTVLTYLIGKKLWDADTGFYAGMLLLGIPYLYTQIPLMLVDVSAMFFLLLAILFFLTALENGRILSILLSSVAITLAFYSKYSMGMMLSVLPVLALTYRSSLPGLRTSAYMGRVFAVFLTSAFLIGMVFVYKFGPMSEQLSLLLSYQKPGLRRWGESFISTFFFQIHPMITMAAGYSVYAAFKRKDIRYTGVLWLLVLVIVFQIRRIRYIIMVFPMLALMASYGLQQIRQKELIRFISLSIVAFSFAVGAFAYLPFLQKNSASNLMNAGKYLDSLGMAEAEVFTVLSENSFVNPAVAVPVLDLFTKTELHYNYAGEKPSSGADMSRSPLRFSWEYKNPKYYKLAEKTDGTAPAVVIISDGAVKEIPAEIKQKITGLSKNASFVTTDNIYEYQTVVTVYY